MLDASSGGVLLSLSYNEVEALIEKMATNSYSLPTERASAQKKGGIHEVSEITSLSAQVATLTKMIKELGQSDAPASDAGATTESAAAIEQAPAGTTSCVFSNTYNAGWRNHPNFRWSNNNNTLQAKKDDAPSTSSNEKATQKATDNSLESMFKAYMTKTDEFMTETRTARQSQDASLKKLETQVGQLATALH